MHWFTADLHLGHTTVAVKYRGFASAAAHDQQIIENIHRALRGDKSPELWILGDVALGGWRTTITALRQFDFPVHVVLGNHDRPAPNNMNGHRYLHEFAQLGGFASVSTVAKLSMSGSRVLLSHYPYSNAPGDTSNLEDFPEYRLRDKGIPVLHGHTHSQHRVSWSEKHTPQLHVGVDAWLLAPVSERQVRVVLDMSH